MKNDKDEYFKEGFIMGIILTILVWICLCNVIESTKIFYGYLTYHKRIYKVSLYSELNYPDANTSFIEQENK